MKTFLTTTEEAHVWSKFAAAALTGIMTKYGMNATFGYKETAEQAAGLADSMLKEYRERERT